MPAVTPASANEASKQVAALAARASAGPPPSQQQPPQSLPPPDVDVAAPPPPPPPPSTQLSILSLLEQSCAEAYEMTSYATCTRMLGEARKLLHASLRDKDKTGASFAQELIGMLAQLAPFLQDEAPLSRLSRQGSPDPMAGGQ